jgi:hypothetical protein
MVIMSIIFQHIAEVFHPLGIRGRGVKLSHGCFSSKRRDANSEGVAVAAGSVVADYVVPALLQRPRENDYATVNNFEPLSAKSFTERHDTTSKTFAPGLFPALSPV